MRHKFDVSRLPNANAKGYVVNTWDVWPGDVVVLAPGVAATLTGAGEWVVCANGREVGRAPHPELRR